MCVCVCVCECECVAACRRSFSLYVDLLGMLVAGESGMKSYSFGDELMALSNREKHIERERKRRMGHNEQKDERVSVRLQSRRFVRLCLTEGGDLSVW